MLRIGRVLLGSKNNIIVAVNIIFSVPLERILLKRMENQFKQFGVSNFH